MAETIAQAVRRIAEELQGGDNVGEYARQLRVIAAQLRDGNCGGDPVTTADEGPGTGGGGGAEPPPDEGPGTGGGGGK